MRTILVIGGGPAGMIAAGAAAERGNKVLLFEKNKKVGKKLLITGKGRCNITNASEMETLFHNISTNPKFLYSSIYGFTNMQVVDFFNRIGVKTKIERGNRVFPVSDRSSTVVDALLQYLKKLKVDIQLNTSIQEIIIEDEVIRGIRTHDDHVIQGDSVIVATGGLSYPTTGSTGDGYTFAKQGGHAIQFCYPSLVGLHTKEKWVKDLQGLSLKNVGICVYAGKKEIYSDFGEMLFTHFGLSGPIILSASRFIIPYLYNKKACISIELDLKPALNEEKLDQRLLRDFDKYQNKDFINALNDLLPLKMIPIIIKASGIHPHKKVNQISKEERQTLLSKLKGLSVTVEKTRGFNEAIITYGGVNVKEVDPKTMESKKIKNLFFAGEVLDVDALTGGYNLQIAFSTGKAAGEYA